MTKQSSGSSMFENMRILVVESSTLSKAEVEGEVLPLLRSHGCDSLQTQSERSKSHPDQVSQFTHVVANSVGFAGYADFEQAMIPVVEFEWVRECCKQGKLVPLRPFNPDPKYFFKQMVITVSDNLDRPGDKEAICGGVRALGGQFSDQLLLTTTHLVSVTVDEDLCCVARECNDNGDSNIKIVRPEWIDDCFKLRRKLNEEPYLLDKFEGVSSALEDLKSSLQGLDVRKSHVDDEKLSAVRSEPFLKDTVFYIGADLELGEKVKETIKALIENSHGIVTESFADASVYVGKYRDGEEYLTASRQGLIVGNLHWIYYMVAHGEWSLPTRKLLHYPVARDGLPGFDKFIIGVTNYTGDGRFYLESLIKAMGGNFTKNLRMANTHLICARPIGKKYEAAASWQRSNGMHIINHLWLEESYRKWKVLDEEFPRFQHFPQDLDFSAILGQTCLDEEVLKNFYRPAVVEDDSAGGDVVADSLLPSSVPASQDESLENDKKRLSSEEPVSVTNETKEENPSIPKKKKQKVDKKKSGSSEAVPKPVTQEAVSKDEADEKNNVERGKRNAKTKAALKLHSDMEDLNSFQQNKKALDKKPKKKAGYEIDVIVTGCENEFELSDANVEKMENRGIYLVKDIDRYINTQDRELYLIAPKVLKTEKFLMSLSLNLERILVPAFLSDVISEDKESAKLPVEDYDLKLTLDYESDSKLKEIWYQPSPDKIENLLNKNGAGSHPVFYKYSIVIFQSQQADNAKNMAYKRILSKHGCDRCDIVTKKTELEKLLKSTEIDENDELRILSKKKIGIKKYDQLVVDYDWVVKKIMLEI